MDHHSQSIQTEQESSSQEKYELVVELYKFFLKIFMDHDFIDGTAAEIINPCDFNHFLPEEDIYLAPKIKDFIEAHVNNSDIEENEEIKNVIRNCKMFARESAMKIQERFQLENSDWSLLSFLQPQNALSRVFHLKLPNLDQIFIRFKTTVPDNANTEMINKEWRNLLKYEYDPEFVKITDPRRFWAILNKFQNRNENPLFKNLCKLAYNALTIPNSNTPPERIWSSYNYIKNQWRASFKSYTVKCMLQPKEYIKSVGGAENFVENEDMFELFNSDIYATENYDNISEGDVFLERERERNTI